MSPLQVKLSKEEWWEASLQSPRLPEIDSGGEEHTSPGGVLAVVIPVLLRC